MTLDRIKMVNHHSLAKIAKDLHFEDFIMVGTSYQLNHISDKNYEDIFEAFCAALYLTNGEAKLKIFITNTIIKYYENKMLEDNHDYKTKFQEYMQRFGKHEIKYITTETIVQNNHVFNTELKCDNIVYGKGISNEGCVLDLAVELGIIEKSGSWFSYNGEKIAQGRDKAKDYLTSNPTIMAEIDAKIREKATEIKE